MLVNKSYGNNKILGLAMSLRATRLQHANKLAPHKKQQLALETLQLWSPISYQVCKLITTFIFLYSFVHSFVRFIL